jgi:hypothetical protein
LEWAKEFQKSNAKILYLCLMGKFSELSNKIQKKQGISKKSADAITATIGREKYGKKKFQQMAVAGKNKKK